MDTNIILAFSGILVTVIIGYVGVKYSLKTQKKISLCFIENDFLPMVKKISKSFESINISYKDKPISENLILLKGSILNDGNSDIDKSIIHKPLEMRIPDGYSFVEVKLTEQSENINIDIHLQNGYLSFNWDLLKNNEFFSFDVLIETEILPETNTSSSQEKYGLDDFYNFNHRITNLQKINKVDLYQIKRNSKRSNFFKWFFRSILPLGFALISFALINNSNYRIDYYIDNKGESVDVKLEPTSVNSIKLESSIDSINYKITPEKFFTQEYLKVRVVKELETFWILLIAGITYVILGFIVIFGELKEIKKKKIMNIITQPNKI